jgi:hypothetical protein
MGTGLQGGKTAGEIRLWRQSNITGTLHYHVLWLLALPWLTAVYSSRYLHTVIGNTAYYAALFR